MLGGEEEYPTIQLLPCHHLQKLDLQSLDVCSFFLDCKKKKKIEKLYYSFLEKFFLFLLLLSDGSGHTQIFNLVRKLQKGTTGLYWTKYMMFIRSSLRM